MGLINLIRQKTSPVRHSQNDTSYLHSYFYPVQYESSLAFLSPAVLDNNSKLGYSCFVELKWRRLSLLPLTTARTLTVSSRLQQYRKSLCATLVSSLVHRNHIKMSTNSADQINTPLMNFFLHDEETIKKFKKLDEKGDKISKIWETPFFQV